MDALPHWFLFVCAGVVGAVVGSFLNVVAYRLPLIVLGQQTHGEEGHVGKGTIQSADFSLALPESNCPSCGHRIRAVENIPLVSYVMLRGHCAACNAPIPALYPVMELAGAAGAMAALFWFGPTAQAMGAMVLIWFGLAITIIDVRHLLIPDALSLSLLWTGLVLNAFGVFAAPSDAIIGAAVGYLGFMAVNWVASVVLGRRAIGQGDFKLFAAIGAWFGWQSLAPVLFIGSATGAIVGLVLLALGLITRDQPIGFGPFLILGAWGVLFFGVDRLTAVSNSLMNVH